MKFNGPSSIGNFGCVVFCELFKIAALESTVRPLARTCAQMGQGKRGFISLQAEITCPFNCRWHNAASLFSVRTTALASLAIG